MGVSSASSECLERIRLVVEGLEGVQQIKDDIVVLKAGKEHDSRLVALLERLTEYNITLRREKCKFEVPEVQEEVQELLADSYLLQSVHEARPGEDLC